MSAIQFNNLIQKNRLLFFFLNSSKSSKNKIFWTVFIFISIPILLAILSFYHGTLNFESANRVGFLNDQLFLSTILVVPLQLLVLHIIIKKYIAFLQEIPSFTSAGNDNEISSFVANSTEYIGKKRLVLTAIKILLFSYFIFSNVKALYFREGAWNSPGNMAEFFLTLLFVAIVIIWLLEILAKLILIVIAQIKLTNNLSSHNLLEIKPLSLDKAGSLSSLSELSLSFTYILVPFMFLAIAHYFTWGTFTIGFAAGLTLLSLSTIFLFLFPLGTVHTIMKTSKKQFLSEVDASYLACTDTLLINIKHSKPDIVNKSDRCESIRHIYERGKKMPVWPFDLRIIVKFMTVVLGPVLLVLIDILLNKLFDTIF